jgi:hypothetical protein
MRRPLLTNQDSVKAINAPLAIFMHLPKTGGSTMRGIIKSIYGPHGARNYSPMKEYLLGKMSEVELRRRELISECDGNSGIRIVYGHIFFGVDAYLRRDCRYFTMLREPIGRLISNYHYRLQHGHCASPRISLDDYASGRSPTAEMRFEADNLQTRLISSESGVPIGAGFGECTPQMLDAAKENLSASMVTFGLTERFDESLELLKEAFGWPGIPSYGRERVTRRYPPAEQTPIPTLEVIRRFNMLDIELYEFGRRLFEERLAAFRLARNHAGAAEG